jgi:hypothetical protein
VLDSKDGQELRWGLGFADLVRLILLHVVIFDSTHKLNKWKRNMFSFLVRDEHKQWIIAAYCLELGGLIDRTYSD